MSEYQKYPMAKGDMKTHEGMFGFAPLLKGRTFNYLLASQREALPGIPILALDVAGYGFVFDGMEIDGSLAVAMGRHPENPKTEMVIGDMFNQSTWDEVHEWLSGRKFSLGVCRPLLPFMDQIRPQAFGDLVKNVSETMHPGGIFYTQVPVGLIPFGSEMSEYISQLADVHVNIPQSRFAEMMEIIKL